MEKHNYCQIARITLHRIWYYAWMFLSLLPILTDGCPSACFCNTMSRIVYCSGKHLEAIPPGIPANSLQLNLNQNNFKNAILRRSNFTGYSEMEHLYLKQCGIEAVMVDTFFDLKKLEWLDLSDNHIRVIEDNTFRGLNLQHLFLNGNENLELAPGAFNDLQTTGLYLNSCSLNVLSLDVLSPLNGSLTKLWLDGNKIERFESRIVELFQYLQHLRIGENPLFCGCESMWLKEFYDKNRQIFEGPQQPKCSTPSKYRDRTFDQISLLELKCELPIFNDVDINFENGKGYLKCGAKSDPAPTLMWVKPNRERVTYSPTTSFGREGVSLNTAVLNLDPESDPTRGTYMCVASNPAGNVSLTLNVSWPVNSQSQTTDTSRDMTSLHAVSTRQGKDVTLQYVDGRHGSTAQINNPDQSTSILDNTFFTLTQLIGAVVGTFVGTLIVSVIIMQLIYNRKRLRTSKTIERKHLNGNGYHHPQPNNFYMTNLEDLEFMDIKGSPCRRT